ncbi:MAG: hypothetical protein HKK67_11780 [Chlorobiaceae bacterium]|nr:hypothetical protein [Chlorobiaceae bacterium]
MTTNKEADVIVVHTCKECVLPVGMSIGIATEHGILMLLRDEWLFGFEDNETGNPERRNHC